MSKRSEDDFINFMNDLYYQNIDDMNTLQKIYDYKTKYNNTKDELLKWLNNGEEKLFRSPTEGNYIVRLMNVSLSPTDSLGRMLHTFNCTAYEIEDFTYEALNSRGFIEIANASTAKIELYSVTFKDNGNKTMSIVYGN